MKLKNSSLIRWTALLVASLTMFGNYYLYDSVAYISIEWEKAFGLSDEQFGLLYSAYSVAAVIILFFGGLFVDRYGTRLSILIFGIICTIAGFVAAFSSGLTSMVVGRFILGLGAEPLIVAVTVAIAKWFKGKALGFALGINLLIARLGSFTVDWSASWGGRFYSSGWQKPMIVASFIGILCSVGAIIYYFIERKAERQSILAKPGETDKLKLSEILTFNKSFWYITLLCVTFYSAIFPFRGFAPKYFQEGHGISLALAGRLMSWLPVTAMIATPLIGLLIDKIGRRASMMMLGSIILVPVFLMMAYTSISLYVAVGMIGIAFSLIPAVMWPSVAYIVDEKKLGTAYSLMFLLQQVGIAGFAYLIGKTNDLSNASAANPAGYTPGMWFFSLLGILALIFSLMLRKAETGPKAHGLEKKAI
jgi:MFS family permease